MDGFVIPGQIYTFLPEEGDVRDRVNLDDYDKEDYSCVISDNRDQRVYHLTLIMSRGTRIITTNDARWISTGDFFR